MNNTKQRYKELGDFLKTRRAKISPSQAGLPEGTRRRTPGLRREELAYLSGIGLTWYTWLEQGRPIHVSTQILESLARVLMLDKQEIIHLYDLADKSHPITFSNFNETINPMVQHVLDSLKYSPALIVDIRWNIIAWNKASSEIFLDFNKLNTCERNLVRIMFTNEQYKELFIDWESQAQSMLSRFRTAFGRNIDDTWGTAFINKLRTENQKFNSWWQMHDIEKDEKVLKTIKHPLLGKLSFEHTSYLISNDTNLKMCIHTPMSQTDTERKIKQYLYKLT